MVKLPPVADGRGSRNGSSSKFDANGNLMKGSSSKPSRGAFVVKNVKEADWAPEKVRARSREPCSLVIRIVTGC